MNTKSGSPPKPSSTPLLQPIKSMNGSYTEKAESNETSKISFSDTASHSSSKYWVIKNLIVFKADFDNLWVVSKFFEFDGSVKINEASELFFDSKLSSTLYLQTML